MSLLNKLVTKFSVFNKTNTTDSDCRSYRFVVVIDCILNQNSRDSGAAKFAAMNWSVLALCEKYQVGMVQMPCPEIAFLGFQRNRPPGTSIREALDTPAGRTSCRKLSIELIHRVEQLIQQEAHFLAVIGGNPESPGCAVHFETNDSALHSGVLMSELKDELDKRNIIVPIIAMRDFEQSLLAEDLHRLEQLFLKAI